MLARTTIGNNALGLGLMTHIMAVVIAMIPSAANDIFIFSAYMIGSFLLSLGIFLELFEMQKNVLRHWHFYVAAILSLLAFIGPIFSCWILYLLNEKETHEQKTAGNFISALFAIKVHPIALFIWSISIVITLSLLIPLNDPYFSRSISNP